MKQFVPITDDMLFDATNFVGPLVPYRFGVACARQLRENERGAADQCPTVNVSPGFDAQFVGHAGIEFEHVARRDLPKDMPGTDRIGRPERAVAC